MASSQFVLRVPAVLAAGTIASGIAMSVHCGSRDSDSAAVGDSGQDASSGVDTGLRESGFETGVAPGVDAGPSTSDVIVVHASPDLFDFRVCFGWSNYRWMNDGSFDADALPWPHDDTHPIASRTYAGVGVGAGAALSRALVPSQPFIFPYLIDARVLAASANPKARCANLVGPQCRGASCLQASDYVTLAEIDIA